MFGKKKPPQRPSRGNNNLSQYGLFEVDPNFSGADNMNFEDDDADLEAELLALTTDVDNPLPKAPARRLRPSNVPKFNVNISSEIKDIPSDEELSGDDDDPDLLQELNDITGVSASETLPSMPAPAPTSQAIDISALLTERLQMYVTAESNAKAAGEISRAKRFSRGVKTLKDLIKQNNSGKTVDSEDIPPEVTVNVQKRDEPPVPEPTPDYDGAGTTDGRAMDPLSSPTTPPPPHPQTPSSPTQHPPDSDLLKLLTERRDQYKVAALKAKRDGDGSLAMNHIKVAKQFEQVIKAVQNGQPVDVSQMPGPPGVTGGACVVVQRDSREQGKGEKQEAEVQGHGSPAGMVSGIVSPPPEELDLSQENLITANSAAEALEQRLNVYKSQEQTAKEQANSSKARRMGRIVKQYDQAIKLNKAGKAVPFDELPTPPGFAPIPGAPPPPTQVTPAAPAVPPPAPSTPASPSSGSAGGTPTRTTPPRPVTTHADRQVALLLARQKEFKLAAYNAKKRGENEQAKEFLRSALGFERPLAAARGGMPVDFASLPLPPKAQSKLEDEYNIVLAEECVEDDQDMVDIMSRFEAQLSKQLKMCMTTRDHYKALGDVTGAHRFENLAVGVTKDLDIIRIAKRTACTSPPKFHYETKSFSIVKSFTDLNDNDFEMVILRGINYNCSNPKEIDTYVKYDFPFPQEEPVADKTATIKDTNNPEYNHKVIFPIQRTARPCLRTFKRHALKLEVHSKGCFISNWISCCRGFFRSDALIGTVLIKLQALENQCEIHDSFDLLDGRKKVGGKLEVQLRLRNPLLSKEVEQITEKWLVLDH